jgi:putative ABC transport system permease protein
VAIALKPPEQGGLPAYRAAYELETALPDISVLQPDDLLVKTEHNLRRTLQSLRAASYIVWPVTALLIGLVFALAANERRREFGLLRALGAERRFIFRLIFLEAMALAAAGAALGLALSTGLVLGFSRLLAESLAAPFARPGVVELFILLASAAALALATGAAAALYPAARAAGLDPYEAIRGGES